MFLEDNDNLFYKLGDNTVLRVAHYDCACNELNLITFPDIQNFSIKDNAVEIDINKHAIWRRVRPICDVDAHGKETLKSLTVILPDQSEPGQPEYEHLKSEYELLKPEYEHLKSEYEKLKVGYEQLKVEGEQLVVEGEQLVVEGEQLRVEARDLKNDQLVIEMMVKGEQFGYESLRVRYGLLERKYKQLLKTCVESSKSKQLETDNPEADDPEAEIVIIPQQAILYNKFISDVLNDITNSMGIKSDILGVESDIPSIMDVDHIIGDITTDIFSIPREMVKQVGNMVYYMDDDIKPKWQSSGKVSDNISSKDADCDIDNHDDVLEIDLRYDQFIDHTGRRAYRLSSGDDLLNYNRVLRVSDRLNFQRGVEFFLKNGEGEINKYTLGMHNGKPIPTMDTNDISYYDLEKFQKIMEDTAVFIKSYRSACIAVTTDRKDWSKTNQVFKFIV